MPPNIEMMEMVLTVTFVTCTGALDANAYLNWQQKVRRKQISNGKFTV